MNDAYSDPAAFLCAGPADRPDKYRLLDSPVHGGEAYVWKATNVGADPTRRELAVRMVRPTHLTRGHNTNELILDKLVASRERNTHIRHLAFVNDFDCFIGLPPHRYGILETAGAWLDPKPEDHPRALADALAGVEHPDLTAAGLMRRIYCVSAWVDGTTLTELVIQARDRGGHGVANGVPLHEAARIIGELCVAVDHLASLGLYHGDLSPRNVMLTRSGELRIIDTAGIREVPGGDSVVMGTPAYAAPDTEKSRAWDRYSVGSLAVYLLTGRPISRYRAIESAKAALADAGFATQIGDLVAETLSPDPATRVEGLVPWYEKLMALLLPYSSTDQRAARGGGNRRRDPFATVGHGPVSRFGGTSVRHYLAHAGRTFVVDTSAEALAREPALDSSEVVPPRLATLDEDRILRGRSYAGDLRWRVDPTMRAISTSRVGSNGAANTMPPVPAQADEPIVGVLDVVLDDFDDPVAVVRGVSGRPWVLVPRDRPEKLPWQAVTAARIGFNFDGQMICFTVTSEGVLAAVREGLTWVETALELPGVYADVAPVLYGSRIVLALASVMGAAIAPLGLFDERPVPIALGSTPCSAVSAVLDPRGRVQVAYTDNHGLNLLTTTVISNPDGSLIPRPLRTYPIPAPSAADLGSGGSIA